MAIAAGIVAFVVFFANGRLIATGDSLSNRFLPFAILRYGTLSLDPVREAAENGHPRHYWLVRARDGRTVSRYPIVTPVLLTPLYVPAALYLERAGFQKDRLESVARLMEKIAAAVVAATATALVFLLVRRRLPLARALLLTSGFAFGTSTWVISSQALWQHGMAELLLAVALLALTGAPGVPAICLAGFASGLLASNRPPDLVLTVALGVYALVAFRRRAIWFAASAAVPILLTLWYNFATFGSARGGYADALGTDFFAGSMAAGALGLLFSPGKGLFVFSPFLLFLAARFRMRRAEGEDSMLALVLFGSFAVQVALYSRTDYRGGYCYGPRFLLDVLPALVFLLVPVVARLRRGPLLLFSAAVAFGIAVQAIGAFCYPMGNSDVDLDPWRRFPPIVEARAGPAPISYRNL